MAQVCDICGKGPQFGNNISHAHNVSRRRWNVNLQKMFRVAISTGVYIGRLAVRPIPRILKIRQAVGGVCLYAPDGSPGG